MKLKETFVTHDTKQEQVMVDISNSFAGLVRNNKTAAFIVNCLKKDTTKEAIVDAMEEKYDASRERMEKDVDAIVEKLRMVGALEE